MAFEEAALEDAREVASGAFALSRQWLRPCPRASSSGPLLTLNQKRNLAPVAASAWVSSEPGAGDDLWHDPKCQSEAVADSPNAPLRTKLQLLKKKAMVVVGVAMRDAAGADGGGAGAG